MSEEQSLIRSRSKKSDESAAWSDNPRPAGRRLGEILLEHQLLDPATLASVLQEQPVSGTRLGALLVERNLIDERAIAWALAQQFSVRYADLRTESPDADALSALPEELARRLSILPLTKSGDTLVVATADPLDTDTIAQVRAVAGVNVQLAVASSSDIRHSLDSVYRSTSDVERLVAAFQSLDERRGVIDLTVEDLGEDAPVVQIVNMIIAQGLRDRASDIHIESQGDQLRVRMRIDGALQDSLLLPSSIGPALVSRIKIMASMNIVERQRPQDGQMSTTIDGRPIDIRISTTPTIFGEKTVMRLLDKSRTLHELQSLGMPPDIFERYRTMVRSPFGMVICTGPTGSGKTTTLYASMAELDIAGKNVMTIEDPVEYIFPSINQIQIKEQAGVTFAGGLKSILRQDPDIILVGEIRDVETARIAVQSALTGHMVLSSLHATDAASALHRFLDMGIESFLVASSVLAVTGQRLVRRICSSCRVTYQPSAEELAFYEAAGGQPKASFTHGAGCNFCGHSGYRDRVGVYELLVVTEEIKALLVRGASQTELRRTAVAQGMRPLREAAIDLVAADVTTISEVLRSIYVL